MTDLDELDRLYAAAAPGRWEVDGCYITGPNNFRIYDEGGHTPQDAAYIIALHNTYPALAAELRALRELEKVMRQIQAWDCLNPADPALLADLPWLKKIMDDALQLLKRARRG